ncbi:MAG: hypothetical protein IPL55_22435 [Saprospiraceae bacterium]|nr:hypothetical protein [Saprospiraceae bacterium]
MIEVIVSILKNIRIPSLIVNALDDNISSENSSYPYKEANQNENLFLMTPKIWRPCRIYYFRNFILLD